MIQFTISKSALPRDNWFLVETCDTVRYRRWKKHQWATIDMLWHFLHSCVWHFHSISNMLISSEIDTLPKTIRVGPMVWNVLAKLRISNQNLCELGETSISIMIPVEKIIQVIFMVWCTASPCNTRTGYYCCSFTWGLGQHTLILGIVVGFNWGLGQHFTGYCCWFMWASDNTLHEDQQTIRWMDSVNPQSDTYNIMLASLGTIPLKIIYAGRLEYARVCVCVCVCKFCRVNEKCGKRHMGGPPMNSINYWNRVTLYYIYLSGTASHGRWTASQTFKISKSRKLFIASESKSLFSCPVRFWATHFTGYH
jgi:hypothetical protein